MTILNIRTLRLYCDDLRYNQRYKHGTTVKFIGFVRKAVQFGLMMGNLEDGSALNFRCETYGTREELKFLVPDQVRAIQALQIARFSLPLVRDLFLFQCFTGLAYCDIVALTEDHLRKDEVRRTWIVKKREKSGVRSLIPLNSICLDIIERHKEFQNIKRIFRDDRYFEPTRGKWFLVVSNQKYNLNTKKLGDLIGLKYGLTSHIARKTFACNALNSSGMSVETVAAMLGHTKIKATLTYNAQDDERRISAEMHSFEFLRI